MNFICFACKKDYSNASNLNKHIVILDDADFGPDLVIATLRINQIKGFCERAKRIVNAGRPACPFCALPVDPLGHLCPRANGYRR